MSPDRFDELPITDDEKRVFAEATDIINAEVRRRMDKEFNKRFGFHRHLARGALIVACIAMAVAVISVIRIQVERSDARQRNAAVIEKLQDAQADLERTKTNCTSTTILKDVLVANLQKIPLQARKEGSFTYNILRDLRGIKCP